MKFWILFAAALLAGCAEEIGQPPVDQCMRREIFQQCLLNAPKGPNSIHNSNDMDEVIEACDSAAYYQARRKSNALIKEECRV